MQIEVNSVEDVLPQPDSLEDEGNEYYLIYLGNYGWNRAMYCEDFFGLVSWYKDYTSKIITPVTHWAKLKNPNF